MAGSAAASAGLAGAAALSEAAVSVVAVPALEASRVHVDRAALVGSGVAAPTAVRLWGRPAVSPRASPLHVLRLMAGGGGGGFRRGQFLPQGYWNGGAVADPRQYHLRRPPNGYGWVTVGPNAYLMQHSTGLILDTAPLY